MPGHTLHHHDAECDEFVKELGQLRRNNVVRCSLVACQPTITTAVCLSVCFAQQSTYSTVKKMTQRQGSVSQLPCSVSSACSTKLQLAV